MKQTQQQRIAKLERKIKEQNEIIYKIGLCLKNQIESIKKIQVTQDKQIDVHNQVVNMINSMNGH